MTPVSTSLGAGTLIMLNRGTFGSSPQLAPSVVASLSQGANLTYSIEVTNDAPDPITKALPVPPPGGPWPTNWVALPGASGLITSTAIPIPFMASAIRINVTAYTGGGVSFAVSQ